MLGRIKSSLSWGSIVGFWAVFFTIIEAIVMCIIDIFLPVKDIDINKKSIKSLQNIGNSELIIKS